MSPIRYGMVGGGPGAFIGAVHRMAAALDGEWTLVAGAFSGDPARSAAQGAELGLDPARVYPSWIAMAEGEAALPPERRIQGVSIVTPNHLHHPVALRFLRDGFHVICDKPLTLTVAEADELVAAAEEHARVFCVTHNYTGYPMVKEAMERIRSGELGEVRRVVVEYAQGWLSTLLEAEGQKQAEWRADPEKAGIASALGDIGTHAHNLVEYVTGQRMTRIFADLGTVVPGRRLEDDAALLFRLERGVRGVLMASQVSLGERNRLRLRVYGTRGALEWCQEDPNDLRLVDPDGTDRILHAGAGTLSERARAHTRLPGGHPEGFIEAFANLYRNVARTIRSRESGTPVPAFAEDFPTVRDGARGVRFIHAAVASGRAGEWRDLPAGEDGGG
ncbi:MAG TPA: Gfo/Idh/MocA family oxidoreductase [Longimicrobiales bacterium]|nr:Gfo/Idh/MocA family oxidoreductase [Longimicrobiales bacterium]